MDFQGEIHVRIIPSTMYALASWASTFNSDSLNTRFAIGSALQINNTVAASTAKTFVDGDVDVTANTIAKTAHGWATGRKVAATNAGGTLPGGLSATDYYVIAFDADHIKLASSANNAIAGTPVDITSAAGGGTHTLTPAALSTASVKLQYSIDGTNWTDIANSSQNITVTGSLYWNLDTPRHTGSIRAVTAIAAGQVQSEILAEVLKYKEQ